MTLEELTQHIHQWGVDRKIIGNGNLQTQWLKLMSEYGELCDSLAKGKSPIDDIGDIYVVLVMMAGVSEADPRDLLRPLRKTCWSVKHTMYTLAVALAGTTTASGLEPLHEYQMRDIAGLLESIAHEHGLTMTQCVEHAWNEIKDRKGYLNEQGVFVKEESA